MIQKNQHKYDTYILPSQAHRVMAANDMLLQLFLLMERFYILIHEANLSSDISPVLY